MPIKIEQNGKKGTVITVNGPLKPSALDEVIRYLRYITLMPKSKATQADADALAAEITRSASRRRRKRLAS